MHPSSPIVANYPVLIYIISFIGVLWIYGKKDIHFKVFASNILKEPSQPPEQING